VQISRSRVPALLPCFHTLTNLYPEIVARWTAVAVLQMAQRNPMKFLGFLFATAVSAVILNPSISTAGLSFGIGPLGGINLGNAAIEGHSNSTVRTGLAMGLRTEFGVTSPYSLLIEPTYVQKGALFNYAVPPFADIKARGELDYIEIPVLIKAKFGAQQVHAFIFAGPSLGINVASKGSIGSFSDTFKNQAANMVFSGEVGGGGAFQIQRYVYLTADSRYSFAFTDALENPVGDIDSWKSQDIRMMLGVLVHITE
jgi:Outer membrane protein beta-barrel domain